MSGNYDKQLAAARVSFARQGLAAAAPPLRFLNMPLRIDPHGGEIFLPDGQSAPFDIAMTVYDYLFHLQSAPCLSGRWVAHERLNAVQGGTLRGRLVVSREAAGAPFSRRLPALRAACALLGGQEREDGDFASVLPLVGELPVYLRFYDADDDFPASLQLLWDANTTQFLTYETTWFATGALLGALRGGEVPAEGGRILTRPHP